MKKLLFIPVLLLLITSCSNEPLAEENKTYGFRDFLKKFKPIQLPYTWTADAANDQFKTIDSIDKAYVRDPVSMYGGILEDTTNFYSVITFLPGDAYVPVLTTYAKTGIILDSKTIIVRGCGPDPCTRYCSSTSILKKDLSVYAVDSIFFFDCDEFDNPIPGTDSLYTLFVNGKVNTNGKIELSKEQKKMEKAALAKGLN